MNMLVGLHIVRPPPVASVEVSVGPCPRVLLGFVLLACTLLQGVVNRSRIGIGRQTRDVRVHGGVQE